VYGAAGLGTRPAVRRPRLENSPLLIAKGYGWLPDARRARGRRTVAARLGGLPVLGIEGPDAARFLYDEDHVRRSHAIPEPVQGTLFGKGAVHTLDGEAHRTRKAMFVGLLMDGDRVAALVDAATAAWDTAVPGWARRGEVVLLDEAAEVLTRAVCGWAGVPVSDDELPSVARDLTAMVDGFATAGPRHWRARRARGRREAWVARLVEDVRSGAATVPDGSVVDVVARHRDADGERVPKHSMVLLDLYGQDHDPELWGDPYAFPPERFLGREIGAFELVPQGAGDPRTNHRCPGEQVTVAVLAALAVRLARLEADVPPQDLSISLRRIPARPASGVVLRVRKTE
jgi:cytochrome P450